MEAPRFTRWFARLRSLNQPQPQRQSVLKALQPATALEQVVALIDQIRSAARACPRCASRCWHRHGHANDLQRFRCRDCRRTFNDLSGTPLARLRLKAKWLGYLDTVLQARTVRKSAALVDVHRNTAFRWRPRFLDWVKLDQPPLSWVKLDQPPLSGIVEADEMFMLESQKGSRTLDRPPRKQGGTAKRRGISRELDAPGARDRRRGDGQSRAGMVARRDVVVTTG